MITVEQRFWSKAEIGPGCWLWKAHRTPRGYGYFWKDGRLVPAHRVAYELTNGPIKQPLVIDHLCRNPQCVNPAHLELVSQAVNIKRGMQYATTANSKKTHCLHGHSLTAENLAQGQRGRRQCKTCRRLRDRKRRAALAKAKGRAPG